MPRSSLIPRREFLDNTLRLALLGLLPLGCNQAKEKDSGSPEKPEPPKRRTGGGRQSWHHEGLVMNSKTKVLHFPTRKVYKYYDEIDPAHLRELAAAGWLSQLESGARLNRDQSGNILELLAMQELRSGVNAQSIARATEILSRAFHKSCDTAAGVNANLYNFRLHELMLQLVALNAEVPNEQKWNFFNARILKPATLRKRQQWMENEPGFNSRVQYILDRQPEYIARLEERAQRYSVT